MAPVWEAKTDWDIFRTLAKATSEIAKVSKSQGSGRIVSVLEGGYNPDVVACAGAAHVAALMAA